MQGLAQAARRVGETLAVLIEFDTGGGRCGVQSPQEAAELARLIVRADGLHFGGLMTYPNNEQTSPFAAETRSLLKPEGIEVEKVSGGGSPRVWETHTFAEVNEHRAGSYIYGDRALMRAGMLSQEQCALTVITTVVSRPTAERGVLDGGSKAFSSDTLGFEEYGLILEYPAANLYRFDEEHGYVDFSACERKPEIGERLRVIPNHCCVVSNLFNEVVGVRNDQVEVVWPVACRGMLQ